MAKKNEVAISIDAVYEQVDELQAENAKLELELGDLREDLKRLISANAQLEDRFSAEHKKRMLERNKAQKSIDDLMVNNERINTQIEAAKELRSLERSKRLASIPKFVIVSAVALALLIVPSELQRLSIIGPQLGYAIESGLMMVIAWCYAIIFDRSRK